MLSVKNLSIISSESTVKQMQGKIIYNKNNSFIDGINDYYQCHCYAGLGVTSF